MTAPPTYEAETPLGLGCGRKVALSVVVRHSSSFGLRRLGWPISLEVGDTNSTSRFASPTAKAMGHPTRSVTRDRVGPNTPGITRGPLLTQQWHTPDRLRTVA